ncbi:choice-of-anchor Q domain-containing protein [Candidatus Electronema sp. TJ]|uniref:choice-of-anchor Q domain-containing protein n=1 Tax=Candidatus Electronema sp. TJ TaxID=3401573 RepID=UPI003AA8E1C2
MKTKKYRRLTAAAIALTVHAPDWTEAKLVIVDDKDCTLQEAISFIYDPGTGEGCVDSGGAGSDTIVLNTDVTLDNRLMVMTSVIIEGNGHTITGNAGKSVFFVDSGHTLTLDNLTIKGGKNGLEFIDSKAVLNKSTVTGHSNRAISTSRGSMTLNNSTVSGNPGTGLYGANCGIVLNGVTVSGNATGLSASGAVATLQGSLISGNSGFDIKDFNSTQWQTNFNLIGSSSKKNAESFSETFLLNSTDISATSDGTNPTALNAILSPLANNGGPTKTHALPVGSPAVDLDEGCIVALSEDQRGISRPSGNGCDAGAFEFESGTAVQRINMEPVYRVLLPN